jgi:uncharacterized protein CbrC (UPF0167 family)
MPELTYGQLQKMVTDLAKEVTRDAEAIRAHAARISEEGEDTARIAEAIGAMRVDPATIGETRDLATLMGAVAKDARDYDWHAETTSRLANAAHSQNRDSHYEFGQAAGRSTVGRDVYDIEREWFRQE